MNYPTQETDLHASQRPGSSEYQLSYLGADGDKACRYKYPVQETGQVAVQIPDEHEDLDPHYQPLNCIVNFRYQTEVGLELRVVRQLGLEQFDRQAIVLFYLLHLTV